MPTTHLFTENDVEDARTTNLIRSESVKATICRHNQELVNADIENIYYYYSVRRLLFLSSNLLHFLFDLNFGKYSLYA